MASNTLRVSIKPKLIQWACERIDAAPEIIESRFPQLEKWQTEKSKPTMKQLEDFAHYTKTPIGYFFLPEPPVIKVPIADFRTSDNEFLHRPSPDLIETIYICQQRQEWYKNFLRSNQEEPLSFVGSVTTRDDVIKVANTIRKHIKFDLEERSNIPTWLEALRRFIELVDASGILVMCNGVVQNNNTRKLIPYEFRGFALSDKMAPLIFINGSDTKAAQMFTLAHELAHIWLAETGISDSIPSKLPANKTEQWCNQIAAEILVPLELVSQLYNKDEKMHNQLKQLAYRFKVSTLVIIRRIYDAGFISKSEFETEYQNELKQILSAKKGSGGDFYLTQAIRIGKRFARALIANTLEGQTLYRDAYKMLGVSKHATFIELAKNLGVE